METNEPDILGKNYNIVWYGNCESDCSELSLDDYDATIDYVFQVFGVDGGWKCWSSDMANVPGINDFNKLICGNAYIIKLKDGVKSVEIPNLSVSSYADDTILHTTPKRITDKCCDVVPTPTPIKTPTPTETPTKISQACFKMIYDTTGDDQFLIVPDGITQLTAEIWGAGGSDGCYRNSGGSGGFAKVIFGVTPGEKIIVGVGQTSTGTTDETRGIPGYSPGGSGGQSGDGSTKCGGAGGGMSGLFRDTISVETVIAIAGGGGGAGGDWTEPGAGGGAGGGKFGTGGFRYSDASIPDGGRPGTHLSGGFGNPNTGGDGGQSGTQFNGGSGKSNASSSGGGGGAGWFGGGAGAAIANEDSPGGGGSGYLNPNFVIGIDEKHSVLEMGSRGFATTNQGGDAILPFETPNRGLAGQGNAHGRIIIYTNDSCEAMQPTPTPVPEKTPTPTPTPEKTPTPTPTPEKTPTPTPTPEKTPTPTPTPEKTPTPTPTSEKTPTPTPTPEKTPTPTPTSEKTPTPTPTPEKTPTPTPTPDKTLTPTPTPAKTPTPTPTPAKTPTPTPTPEKTPTPTPTPAKTPTPTPEPTDCCSGLGHVHPKTWMTHGKNQGDDTNDWGVRVAGLEPSGKLCYDYPNGTTELPGWNRGESHTWTLQLQGPTINALPSEEQFSMQKTIGIFYAGGPPSTDRNKIVYQSPDGVCFEGELVAGTSGITFLTEIT